MQSIGSASEFCGQVTQFCLILRQELVAQWDHLSELPISSQSASTFTESLMLCPTEHAARLCIRKNLPGALSFIFAIQGIQQRMEKGSAQLPLEPTDSHTTFFLLACAVQDYLASVSLPVES